MITKDIFRVIMDSFNILVEDDPIFAKMLKWIFDILKEDEIDSESEEALNMIMMLITDYARCYDMMIKTCFKGDDHEAQKLQGGS